MDLVNSVTQNSNNRNVTMENQGDDGNGRGGDNGGPPSRGSRSPQQEQEQQKQPAAEDGVSQQMAAPQHPNESTVVGTFGAGMSPASSGAKTTTTTTTSTTMTMTAPPSEPKSQVPDYLRAIGMDPRKFWPKKYRFTREKPPGQHNPLTIAQRNFYETNGYIVFDDCVNKRLLDAIRGQHKESALVSEFLLDKLLIKNNRLLQYVKCFCDERLMLMTHRLIEHFHASSSNSGSSSSSNDNNDTALKDLIDNRQQKRQLLFRDWMYLPFRPIDKVCCAITAIEPLEHVLLIVPGTHRVGQCSISSTLDNVSAAYDSSQEKTCQSREIFECSPERLSTLVERSKKGFKYVNLKPGQTLFYHPGLIHGFSEDLINFRKSQLASVAYYAAADCEYIDLRKSSPSLLLGQEGRPLVPISLAHFGAHENPIDYTSWLDKPRLVGQNNNKL